MSRFFFFFFNDTATTEIYTLSLHDALPIFSTFSTAMPPLCWSFVPDGQGQSSLRQDILLHFLNATVDAFVRERSEEHTSELQSHSDLVCRLLLEKKKKPSAFSTILAPLSAC